MKWMQEDIGCELAEEENSIEEESQWWIGMSSVDGFEEMDWKWFAFGWEGMKRSGDDCNCETLTRDDVGDTGVRPNKLGLRIQGIADSHDSSPTLRLSEESKNRRQNQQIISFHKRIHRLNQHHKRSQSSEQHSLWREIPFCFQGVAFIQQQRLSFTSTMSKHLTHPFHTSFGP